MEKPDEYLYSSAKAYSIEEGLLEIIKPGRILKTE
jgi:hypothetical protein